MGKRLGLLRAVYLVCASCMGSFAFAFDTGVISVSIQSKLEFLITDFTLRRRCSRVEIL